jgi:hypothetical protein
MIDLINLPIDITNHILNFRDFLNKTNPCLNMIMKNHSWEEDTIFEEDWIQSNWEFLVERELLGKDRYLFPICGFRMTCPEKQSQFKVVCELNEKPRLNDRKQKYNYQGEELLLFGFFTIRQDGFRTTGLPLEYVQLCTFPKKTLYFVSVSSCRFILKEFEGSFI